VNGNPMPAPIGLLGGTFDPIHVGHLALARCALDQLRLAEVRFIPTASSWQKEPAHVTPAAQRAHLVELAIRDEPRFVLDMHEIERGGASYTIDTLRALRTALGAGVPLVLIVGGDQFENLHTWRDWRALIDCAHIAVARRNAAELRLNETLRPFFDRHAAPPAAVHAAPAGACVTIDMPGVDASATEIRALLRQPAGPAQDARLRALLPAAVLDYIRAFGLYPP
jgi:nicotinate-nucleotide adenylyltransferase